MTIVLADCRASHQEAYSDLRRQGQLKRSWALGVAQATNGSQAVSIDDGLTWGSIGQILGYLLGEVDKETQEKLYAAMYNQLCASDHGKGLLPTTD